MPFQFRSRFSILRGMVSFIPLPPVRLPYGAEDAVPGGRTYRGVRCQQAGGHFAHSDLIHLLKDIPPCFPAHLVPIQGRQHLKEHLFPAHFEGTFIDRVPDAGASLIHFAVFRSRASARAIADAFGTLHGTDKSSFLQQAVSTHPAAPDRAFNGDLGSFEQLLSEGFSPERFVWRLPTATWCKKRHGGLPKLALGQYFTFPRLTQTVSNVTYSLDE